LAIGEDGRSLLKQTLLDFIDPYKELSLYIHIPYCSSKCSYCSFYSITALKSLDDYHKKLVSELKQLVSVREKGFKTVYIGGGTPSLLSLEQLKEILEVVSSLGFAQEVTLEVNPQDLVENYLQLSEVGLSRISVGIESLDENSLKILGRKTSLEDLKRALKIIKKFKREKVFKVNCDLINSIPTQTKESALNDIEKLINLSEADHISLYNLSIEEGTFLAKQIKNDLLTLYDEDYQAEVLKDSWQLLKKLGFEHYEISNFALDENHRSMHNSLTWELKDYVGLGCSAVSTINSCRITGNIGINNYINSDNFSTYTFEKLEKYTLLEEYLMVRLRTKEGLDKKDWLQNFNFDFDLLLNNSIKQTLLPLETLYNNSTSNFALTEEGFMLSDAIILKFIDALDVLLDS